MTLSQLVLVFKVVDEISLLPLIRQKFGLCFYFPSSLVFHSLNGVCQGIHPQNLTVQYVFSCIPSLYVIVWICKLCYM